jgi:hypothetical protein
MARKVFYSFHFDVDGWRAAKVRNIGKLESNNPVSDNEWEQVKKGGDAAIQRWIDAQMFGRSCCVVLVGPQTASRKWVRYEIEESWKSRKGVVGIRIHNITDRFDLTAPPGPNPFNLWVNGLLLSSVVSLHDPVGWDSKSVYGSISANLEGWVEAAIAVRARYP